MHVIQIDPEVVFQALADSTRVRVVRLLVAEEQIVRDALEGMAGTWLIGAVIAIIVAAGALRMLRLR